ncbi:MAG TPA: BTAD domain-containing putative transcriptional regulator [Mycobacteriales bacterium]|nr:BTAD domain-containing putative transcriptional regulator [Mycobacteriales bacterium]
MIVHDLGTMVVELDGREIPPGGKKPAAILALLLINANRRVSVDALMEAMWGDRGGPGNPSTLDSHIWRVRRLLEPGRGPHEAPRILINDVAGYRLLVSPDQIDSARFERMVDDARGRLAGRRPSLALELLEAAAALWRGRPYTPLSDQDWAAAAVARLDETRTQALELQLDALLDLGRAEQAVVASEPLVREMPYRERLWAARMLALHRCGRTEQALQAYRHARAVLRDEVGLEPGAELQTLQRRILEQDPDLLATVPSDDAPARPVEVHLPGRPSTLIGRDADLGGVGAHLGTGPLVTVTGPAGAGKTRLAIDAARAAAPRFPDGVWYVDLTTIEDPALVVDLVVAQIGFGATTALPLDALAAYLQQRRLLLVLDNCEHLLPGIATMVETLLGSDATESVILATSREALGVDGETIWSLAPLPVTAAGGTMPPAVELFLARLTAADPAFRLDDGSRRQVEQICADLDGVPLALELAAARIRAYSLDEIADQVRQDPGALGAVGGARAEHHQTLHAAIQWSYQLLSPAEQRLHEELSVLPGPFTRRLASAVATPAAGPGGVDLLPLLVNRSLLTAIRPTRAGGPSTFRQLATVRAHAARLLTSSGRANELLDRRDSWVLAEIASRPRLGSVESARWYRTLDDDYPAVRAALQRTLGERRDPAGAPAAAALLMYWFYREQLLEGSRWLQLGAELIPHLSPAGAVAVHLANAAALTFRSRPDLARPHLDTVAQRLPELALADLPRAGDLLTVVAASAMLDEDYALAVQLVDRAGEIADRTADADLAVLSRAAGALVQPVPDAGFIDRAEAIHAEAMERGHLTAAWMSSNALALAALRTGRPEHGLRWSARSIELFMEFGAHQGGPWLEVRADLLAMAGKAESAVRVYSAARSASRRAGTTWPRLTLSRSLLAQVRADLGRDRYEAAWRDGEQLTLTDIVTAGDTA